MISELARLDRDAVALRSLPKMKRKKPYQTQMGQIILTRVRPLKCFNTSPLSRSGATTRLENFGEEVSVI
jgi:hypothetical protein